MSRHPKHSDQAARERRIEERLAWRERQMEVAFRQHEAKRLAAAQQVDDPGEEAA